MLSCEFYEDQQEKREKFRRLWENPESLIRGGAGLNYNLWPESGCSLAEARERVIGPQGKRRLRRTSQQHSKDGKIQQDDFYSALKASRLIGVGRTKGSQQQVIAPSFWVALTGVDLKASTATQVDGLRLEDVCIFPALGAPNGIALLDGLSFAEAFQKHVLEDPEVKALSREAIRLCPEYARTFHDGYCYPNGMKEWPLGTFGLIESGYEEGSNNPIGWLAPPEPPAVAFAVRALNHRYFLLIRLLRDRHLSGLALSTASGQQETILHSFWSHQDFFIDARTGDIYQENVDCVEPPFDLTIKRWSGTVLRRVSPTIAKVTEPVLQPSRAARPSLHNGKKARVGAKRQRVEEAMSAAGIDWKNTSLTPSEIAGAIVPHLPAYQKENQYRSLCRMISRIILSSN